MPITYPLLHPTDPGFQEFVWEPDSAVAVQSNEFNFKSRAYAWQGARRRARVKVAPMTEIAQARDWQTFVLKLNGREGTFLMQDPLHSEHHGSFDLNDVYVPRVFGTQTPGGFALETDGWEPSMVNVVVKGDYIAIDYRLYMVLSDSSASTAGEAGIEVWPKITAEVLDNTEIFVGEQAWGKFRMMEFPRFPYDLDTYMNGFEFTCEEAF